MSGALRDRADSGPSTPRFFLAIFAVLSALYACGHFHRSAGAVISPVLNKELGLDAQELGMIMAGLFLAAGLTQIPFGILLDQYGPRRSVTALLFVGILGAFLFPLAQDWPLLLFARMLIGAGFCGVFMSSIVIFASWTPPDRLTTWTGRITAIGGCGGLFATTPLAAAIEYFGWRGAHFGIAAITVLLVAVGYLIIRDHPPAQPPPARSGSGGTTLRSGLEGLLQVLREPRARPMLIVAPFMYLPMQMTVGLWAGPYLLEVHGAEPLTRGNILFAMMALHLIAAFLIGPVERRLGSRKWIVIGGALLQSTLFLSLALFGQTSLTLTVALLFGIAVVGPIYVVVMVHYQTSFPREMTGRVVSLMTAISVFGIFINQAGSSSIVRALADPDMIGSRLAFSTVFALIGVIFLFVAATYLNTRDTKV